MAKRSQSQMYKAYLENDGRKSRCQVCFNVGFLEGCCFDRELGPGTIIIATVTCIMEGSMYAIVFFWSPSLDRVRPALAGETPYGIVFANLMAAM